MFSWLNQLGWSGTFGMLLMLFHSVRGVEDDHCPEVTHIEFNVLGAGGQSPVKLFGCGFSETAFSLQSGLVDEGNKIYMEHEWQTFEASLVDQGPSVMIFIPPPAPPGKYRIVVSLNGYRLPQKKMCGGHGCDIQFVGRITPSVSFINRPYTAPGDAIIIGGNLFPHDNEEKIRITVGNSDCALMFHRISTPANHSTELGKGTLMCNSPDIEVGNQNVSIVRSAPYGRSVTEPGAHRVGRSDELFMVQRYSLITSVTPYSAPTGGAELLIRGVNLFGRKSVEIYVGSERCMPSEVHPSMIRCTLPEIREKSHTSLYAGNRVVSSLKKHTTLSQEVTVRSVDGADVLSPNISGFNLYNVSAQRHPVQYDNVFVSPRDSRYQFVIRGTNNATLIGGRLKESRHSILNTTSESNFYELQKNELFHIRMNVDTHNEGELCVRIFETSICASQFPQSIPSKQRIRFWTPVADEIQEIDHAALTRTVFKGTGEVQKVQFSRNFGAFSVCLYGACSPKLTSKAIDAIGMKEVVDQLLFTTRTKVALLISTSDQVKMLIEFPDDYGDVDLLEIRKSNSTKFQPKVAEIVKGVSSVNGKIRPSYAGRPAPSRYYVNASVNEITNVYRQLGRSLCPQKLTSPDPAKTHLLMDFEDSEEAHITSEEAFCGAHSVHNPKEITFPRGIELISYPYLCYAYKGNVTGTVEYRYSAKDQEKIPVNKLHVQKMALTNLNFDRWHFACHNVLNIIQSVLSEEYSDLLLLGFRVKNDDHFWHGKLDLFLDTISVSTEPVDPNPEDVETWPRFPVHKFDDIVIELDKLDPWKFTVRIQSKHCVTNYTWFGMAGEYNIKEIYIDEEIRITNNQWPRGTSMTIRRIQKASGNRILGKVQLAFKGVLLPPLPVDCCNKELVQSILSLHRLLGAVRVRTRDGCSNFAYEIDLISLPGSQPLIEFKGWIGLSDPNVKVRVELIEDGHLMLCPIPEDMLATVEVKPQVRVYVDDIPARCKTTCAHVFDDSLIPNLTMYEIHQENDILSIDVLGTGFDHQVFANNELLLYAGNVTLEPLVAHRASALSASFYYGPLVTVPAGVIKIKLYVRSAGFAETTFDVDLGTEQAEISEFTPTTGGVAGGTLLVIHGSRFCQSANVIVGDQMCQMISISHNLIRCRTPRSADVGSVSVKIQQNGIHMIANGFYLYDSNLTPLVFDITPNSRLPLRGQTVLQILGSGFTQQTNVMVGDVAATEFIALEYNMIVFSAPAQNRPGRKTITIYSDPKGIAEPSEYVEYTYTVNELSLHAGSWMGGQTVRLSGENLDDTTNVWFEVVPNQNALCHGDRGRRECKLLEVTATYITCVTQPLTREHVVKNTGVDSVRGSGYKWEPSVLTIVQGDSVTWNWTTPIGRGILLGVFEIISLENMLPKESIHSLKMAETGSFSRIFPQPGYFYYASSLSFTMVGVIHVQPFGDCLTRVRVKQDEKEADYPNTHEYSDFNLFHRCSGLERCTELDVGDVNTNPWYLFAFRGCLTLLVHGQFSLLDSVNTGITFDTEGHESCQNDLQIQMDQLNCDPGSIVSKSSNRLECFVPNEVYLSLVQSLEPRITHRILGSTLLTEGGVRYQPPRRVYPKWDQDVEQGSLFGGCSIKIAGMRFDADHPGENRVRLNNSQYECAIQSVNSSEITCQVIATQKDFQVVNTTVELSYTVEVKDGLENKWISAPCLVPGHCSYILNKSITPYIESVNPHIVSGLETLNVTGSMLMVCPNEYNTTEIRVGPVRCSLLSYDVVSGVAICRLEENLPYGDHILSYLTSPRGYAYVPSSERIVSLPQVEMIEPPEAMWGTTTRIRLTGNGLDAPLLSIYIGLFECNQTQEPRHSSELYCILSTSGDFPQSLPNTVDVVLHWEYNGSLKLQQSFTFVSPTNNSSIRSMCSLDHKQYSNFGKCFPDLLNWIKDGSEGQYKLPTSELASIMNKSIAQFVALETSLEVYTISPDKGSLQGGQILQVTGMGFHSMDVHVWICGQPCINLHAISTFLSCETPAQNSTTDLVCSIEFESNGEYYVRNNTYAYLVTETPVIRSVNPRSGGTAGGTSITLIGENLASSVHIVVVMIGTQRCVTNFQNESVITCVTGMHWPPEELAITIKVHNQGLAKCNFTFLYIDRWSSLATWTGTKSIPRAGDMVIINKDNIITLDQTTPDLSLVLIDGGVLRFDPTQDAELSAKYILIINNGSLEIGSRDKPYTKKATITLYGHVKDKELPLYGSKVLALRSGRIAIHGVSHPPVWTKLAQSVEKGSRIIVVNDPVTWTPGSQILLTSTSNKMEDEVHEIESVHGNQTILTLKREILFRRIAHRTQGSHGKEILLSAEVALLTRTVQIRGRLEDVASGNMSRCTTLFDKESEVFSNCNAHHTTEPHASDQYGGHIFVGGSSAKGDTPLVQLENVELSNLGQAYRPARHPVYFHMTGSVKGSYIRGSAIHHSFNRGLVLRNTHDLELDNCVIYDIQGSGLCLLDGVEYNNVITRNLIAGIRATRNLYEEDLQPAAFWLANPQNVIERNIAAGGTHTGFAYKLPDHPTGLSSTIHKCPQLSQLGRFENNEVHSHGTYALLISDAYFPTRDSRCGSRRWITSPFTLSVAWNNGLGVFCRNCGSVAFINMTLINNHGTAMQTDITYISTENPDSPHVYGKSLLVGYDTDLKPTVDKCQSNGVTLPTSPGLFVSDMEFRLFNGPGCAAIRGPVQKASSCIKHCLGYEYSLRGIKWTDTNNRIQFDHPSTFVIRDLDGSVASGLPNVSLLAGALIVAASGHWPRDKCDPEVFGNLGSPFAWGRLSGTRCSPETNVIRMEVLLEPHIPIEQRQIRLTVLDGAIEGIEQPGQWISPQNSNAWIGLLASGYTYVIEWTPIGLSNLSYNANFQALGFGEYLIIRHVNIPEKPDRVRLLETDSYQEVSTKPIDVKLSENGTIFYNKTGQYLEYILRFGQHVGAMRNIHFDMYQCATPNCIWTARIFSDSDILRTRFIFWSDDESWKQSSMEKPLVSGSSLSIPKQVHLILDTNVSVELDILRIEGTLEFQSGQPHDPRHFKIAFERMVIYGGHLKAGRAEFEPLVYATLELRMMGRNNDPDRFSDISKPMIGPNTMAVFGHLNLFADRRYPSWTRLATSAAVGSKQLYLAEEASNWQPGDAIVIATTSKDYLQSEVRTITDISNDRRVITVDQKLGFSHIAYNDSYGAENFRTAAEVGILQSNIIVTSDDHLTDPIYGGSLLISNVMDGYFYRRLSGVLFRRMGRTRHGISQAAVQFQNIGSVGYESYLVGCIFLESQGTALSAFKTDELRFQDNVIYNTKGKALILRGDKHEVTRNLFIETHCADASATKVTEESAAVDITKTLRLTWRLNAVAGASCVGLKMHGMKCAPSSFEDIKSNVIHSCPFGILSIDAERTCSHIHHVKIYSTSRLAIFWSRTSAIQASYVQLVDNAVGFYPIMEETKRSAFLQPSNLLNISHSLIVGRSGRQNCTDGIRPQLGIQDHDYEATWPISDTGSGQGHLGMFISQFLYPQNFEHRLSDNMWKVEGATLEHNTFANFGSVCPNKTDILMSSDLTHGNSIQTMFLKYSSLINVTHDHILRYRTPSNESETSLCGDMECDSHKTVLVVDVDGGVFGAPRTIVPKWQYDRHGVEIGRIPRRMLISSNGLKMRPEEIWSFKGLNPDNRCHLDSPMNAYICENDLSQRLLLIQPAFDDTALWRLGPATIVTDSLANKSVDIVNGLFVCLDQSCTLAKELFPVIVAVNQSLSVYFTRGDPDRLHLRLVSAPDNYRVRIAVDYRQAPRIDVYVNGKYRVPENGLLNEQGQLIINDTVDSDSYIPNVHDHSIGANVYDQKTQLLYAILGSHCAVEIRITSYLKLTLLVTPNEVDEFYSVNLRRKLAKFLGISEQQVFVSGPIMERTHHMHHRATRSVPSIVQIDVQIAEPLKNNLTTDTNKLDLKEIRSKLISSIETDALSQVMNVSISGFHMKSHLSESERNRWAPKAEQGARGEPTLDQVEQNYQSDGRWHLAIDTAATVHERFAFDLRIRILDADGKKVSSLGSPSRPWRVQIRRVNSSEILGVRLRQDYVLSKTGSMRMKNLVALQSGDISFTIFAHSFDGRETLLSNQLIHVQPVTFALHVTSIGMNETEATDNPGQLIYRMEVRNSDTGKLVNVSEMPHQYWTLETYECHESDEKPANNITTIRSVRKGFVQLWHVQRLEQFDPVFSCITAKLHTTDRAKILELNLVKLDSTQTMATSRRNMLQRHMTFAIRDPQRKLYGMDEKIKRLLRATLNMQYPYLKIIDLQVQAAQSTVNVRLKISAIEHSLIEGSVRTIREGIETGSFEIVIDNEAYEIDPESLQVHSVPDISKRNAATSAPEKLVPLVEQLTTAKYRPTVPKRLSGSEASPHTSKRNAATSAPLVGQLTTAKYRSTVPKRLSGSEASTVLRSLKAAMALMQMAINALRGYQL